MPTDGTHAGLGANETSPSPHGAPAVSVRRPHWRSGPRTPGGRGLRRLLGRIPPGWRMPLATYLACQVIFLLWWVAFYPALLSYDSFIYVFHVTTGPWVDNYSVLYDALVGLSLHATGGIAALTLLQTIAASALLAYLVTVFRHLGVPGRRTAIAAVVLAALPSTGGFILFLFKDVPFTLCTIAVVATVARLVSLRGHPGGARRSARLVIVVGLEFLGLMLFRLNGFLVVIIALLVMLPAFPGLRARLTVVTAAAIGVAAILNLVIYPAVGIRKPPSSLAFGPAYGDIAVVYAEDPRAFTQADLRVMAQVMPLPQWRRSANCYDSDPTTSSPHFTVRAAKVSGQLFQVWLHLFGQVPNLITSARICRGSIAWQVFPGPGLGKTIRSPDEVPANFFGLAPRVATNPYGSALYRHPLSATVNKVMSFWWQLSLTSQLDWLLWRGAFWCYLAYLVLFLFARRRRNWALLAIGAAVIGQQLTVLMDIPGPLYRYMVGTIMIGILLIPLLFAGKRSAPARRGTLTAIRTDSGRGPG